MNNLTLKRTVTKQECPWLDKDLPAGTQVTKYDGPTYGCVSDNGFAATVSGIQGFVELPNDSV